MTKLYKTYRNATRAGSADAVTLDGAQGFMHVADVLVAEVIDEGRASASASQTRVFRAVKTTSGLFGTTWQDRIGTIAESMPTRVSTLFTTEAAARAALAATLARYAADSRWQHGR